MSEKLSKDELKEILQAWREDEWNLKGGMVRALALKGKKDKAREVALEADLRERAYHQLVELIEAQAEPSEEWIEEKAREAIRLRQDFFPRYNFEIDAYKDFIRNLPSQAPMRKPKVSTRWVEEWCKAILINSGTTSDEFGVRHQIFKMLEEAGVEVEE